MLRLLYVHYVLLSTSKNQRETSTIKEALEKKSHRKVISQKEREVAVETALDRMRISGKCGRL